jgi:hypothetical protein
VSAARRAVPFVVLFACAKTPGAPATSGATSAEPVFSREAFATARGDAGAAEPPIPTTVVPRALDELLAAAPATPPAARDHDALLGTDTGLPGDGNVEHRALPSAEPAKPRVRIGQVTTEPGMSGPAIERAARAELYWPLVQRCRDKDGAILPPEVVHVQFNLDQDGYVVPATVLAVAKDARFADAARCMARELTATTFRAPASVRGRPSGVVMDVPSVD